MKDSMLINGVKIINIEGKDIKRGFSFLDKSGKLAKYKFKGNFDFSQGLMELGKICKQKNIELYENIDGKLYSKILLCLKFNYSNSENVRIEKIASKQRAKSNIDNLETENKDNAEELIRKLRLERDAKLKGVKDKNEISNIRQHYKEEISETRRVRDENIINEKILIKDELKNHINKLDESASRNGIREDLYTNNLIIDNRVYRRFLRSSGSARVGKCLFILEDVYEEMMEYALAGNEVVEGMEIDLPSYEAYLGLVNTALEDILTTLKPENILLVEDVHSRPHLEKCMVTSLVDDKLHTEIENYDVSNNIFDGASLIDFSLLEEKYCIAGGVQLRNKWFKGFATGCNMQLFFSNQGVTDVSQLNGWTIARDIKDILFITTKSSVKYLKTNKGREGFIKWLGIIDNIWGICGHPHESKFVNGQYVQAHYQLLNNIQLNPSEVAEVTKESKEYAELLKNDLEVFKMHINAEIDTENQLDAEENDDYDEFSIKRMSDSSKFMSTMIQLNDDFARTKVFKDYRKDIIDNFVENCKRGHILIYGCYATVIMNSIDYLYHAIDKNWEATKEQSHMEHGSIMCDYFEYNQDLLCSRSPMPVQGNILIARNIENDEVRNYFSYKGKLSKFIMHINVIESNFCERGSGFDGDGDKFLITNQYRLLENAKKNYNEFLVPVNAVKSKEEIKYYWNNKSKAELDIKCSQNNIGRIINDSMILVSEYWHRINSGESYENLRPLYRYICELSIMSNLAIDACKRPVPYDEEAELERIENCTYFRPKEVIQVKEKVTWTDKEGIVHNKTYKGKGGKKKQAYKKNENGDYVLRDKRAKVRPMFFKLVGQGQEYSFKNFDCSMDYLQRIMKIKRSSGKSFIKLSDLFSSHANGLKTGKAQKRDIDRIVGTEEIEGVIEKLNDKIDSIKAKKDLNSIESNDEITNAKVEAVEELRKIRYGKGITDETMIAILKRLDKDYQNKNSSGLNSIGRLILSSLYEAYKNRFIKMFKKNTKEVRQLVEDENGDIKIFNKTYKKISVKKDIKLKFFENRKAV